MKPGPFGAWHIGPRCPPLQIGLAASLRISLFPLAQRCRAASQIYRSAEGACDRHHVPRQLVFQGRRSKDSRAE